MAAKFDNIPGHKAIEIPAPDFSKIPGHTKLEPVSPIVDADFYHDFVMDRDGRILPANEVVAITEEQ
jgi:hypothetical protein